MNRLICSALLVLTATSTPAWPQGKLDSHPMKAASQAQGSGNTGAKIFKGYALTELTAAGLLYDLQATATHHKIGSPQPAVAAELEKLWRSEFRSQPK